MPLEQCVYVCQIIKYSQFRDITPESEGVLRLMDMDHHEHTLQCFGWLVAAGSLVTTKRVQFGNTGAPNTRQQSHTANTQQATARDALTRQYSWCVILLSVCPKRAFIFGLTKLHKTLLREILLNLHHQPKKAATDRILL